MILLDEWRNSNIATRKERTRDHGLLYSGLEKPNTKDHQHSTSCFHEDHTMELFCLTSIQRIRNYESRHNNTETACTIFTNGSDETA